MVDRGTMDYAIKFWERQLGAKEVGGPLREIASMRAKEVGISGVRTLVIDSPIFNAMGIILPDNSSLIALSKGVIDSDKITRNSIIDAIIVHELSHVKDGMRYLQIKSALPLIMPAVSLLAWHILKQTKLLSNDETAEQMKNDEIFYQNNPFGLNKDTIQKSPFWREIKSLSQDVAAVAFGAATGMIGARQMALSAEYRADKLAADIVSPKTMKDGLIAAYENHMNAEYTMSESEKMADSVLREFGKIDASYLERLYNHYIANPHPTTEQRIARLDAMMEAKSTTRNVAKLFPETRIAIRDIAASERMVLDLVTQAMKIKV